MRKMTRLLALLISLMALAACGAGRSEEAPDVTLFATSVGKGDALILKVGDYACLIDAGKARARGKVRSAMEFMGVEALDAVFLTHTDGDHAGGLGWLAESDIPVGAWYASGYYTGVKADKHLAQKAASKRGQSVQWLIRGDSIALGNTGATLRVLAPERRFDDKDDNNSLVMLLETAQGKMLLTGDMELPEEAVLLSEQDDLRCAALKVPNHADDDTVSQAFADAVSAQVAVISTDSDEKPGTPDPGVLSRLASAGTACYVTQDAGLGLKVALNDGAASVTQVDIEAPRTSGVVIQSVVPRGDLITLRNDGSDLDMTDWYLYSDRGGELYVFPEGYVLPAGATVVVGTKSSDDGAYDLLWNDKKVVHKSKRDNIELYDGWGRVIDAMSNGL